MADAEHYAVLLQRRRAELLDELGRVESALQRIEQGVFGFCECCGQAIGQARLSRVPATSWCSACKQDYERRRGIHQTDDAA